MQNEPERFTVWHGLLLAEVAVLLISLLMPITPSKTGSSRGIPHLLMDDPSYLEQVFVYFVMTNLLLVVLSGIFALWLRLGKKQ